MKKNMKYALVISLAVCLLLAAYFYLPVHIMVFAIMYHITESYDFVFDQPTVFYTELPHYQMLKGYDIETHAQPFGFLNIGQVKITLNCTITNNASQPFLSFNLTIDTLAEQKIQFYRNYDASLRSQQVTIFLDASALVHFTDGTPDILKDFHGQWALTLP